MSVSMLGEALRTVCGPLGDLNRKLSGPNGEEWLVALKRFLRKENPWDLSVTAFPVWKTLTVGGVAKDELLRRLEKGRISVSNWARDIMGQPGFTTSVEPQEVSFVRLKVKDLGFTEMPTTTELFNEGRLAGFGLELCQPEDGPHLRLADTDQPQGTWYWMAMPPITDSDGNPNIFHVVHDKDERWLRASIANPADRWDLEFAIVFRLPK